MWLEILSTAAAIGTFVVITATAVAAIVQLRHLRTSNQLQALLTVLSMPYDPVLREAMDFVSTDLSTRLRDESFVKSLDDKPAPRTIHKELHAADYYERLGSFVKNGLIAPELYLDCSSPELAWERLRPVIEIMRRKRGPYVYENFEYLVSLARQWDAEHPAGNYPKGAKRITD